MKDDLCGTKRALAGMIRAYLVERDVEGTLHHVTRDVFSVGLGDGEPVLGREALGNQLQREITADPRPFEIEDQRFDAKESETGVIILCRMKLKRALESDGVMEADACLTASLQKDYQDYKVSGIHLSVEPAWGIGLADRLLIRKGGTGSSVDLTLDGLDPDKQALINTIPVGVGEIALDEGLTLINANQSLYLLYGYTPGQMQEELGNQLAKLMKPHALTALRDAIKNARLESSGLFETESCITRRDGKRVNLLLRGLLLPGKNVDRICGVMVDITARKRAERTLKRNEEKLRVALSKTSNTLFDYDIEQQAIEWPQKAREALGVPQRVEAAPQALVSMGTVCAESAGDWLEMFRLISEGVKTASCVVRMHDAQGGVVWNHITLTALADTGRAIGILEDVTRQKERELRYRQREQYRRALLTEAVVYFEMNISRNQVELCQGDWAYLPPDAAKHSSYDGLLDLLASQVVFSQDREAYERAYNRRQVIDSFEAGLLELRQEHRWVRQDGTMRWVANTIHMVQDTDTGDIRGFAFIRDIDRQKREELALRYRSERDALTGLYNKRQTEQLITKILQASEPNTGHAFFIIDLDHFKMVNDTYGHMAGDALLADCARQLSAIFRHDDVMGRIGGDEFVVFLRDIDSCQFVADKAKQISTALEQSTEQARMGVNCTCSVGVAVYPQDGQRFEQLYQRADIALYEAKRKGRNHFVCYDPSLDHGQWTPQWRTAIDSEGGQ